MTEAKKQHPRGKNYRDGLNEWLERSAKILEEAEAARKK